MKILIVHNQYQSHHIGGEDLVVSREIRGLKKALGESNVFEYQVSNDDIKSVKLMVSLWGDKVHYNNIYHLVREHQIDLVHVHNFFPLLTPTVFAAAKEAGAKVVHTLHNFRWWCLSGILYRDDIGACEACVTKPLALAGINNKCYRNSTIQSTASALAFSWYQLKDYHQYIDAYFVLSEFQRQKVTQWLPPEKIWLKPNAIDLPSNPNQAEKCDYIFIGRLEASKGIELLLSVWNELPESYVLNIIGGANDNALSTQYSKHNIRFLGKQSHEQTLAHLSRAKYLIHPSLTYETFGLTLVEALAHATPVIALDRGPRQEFVRSGFNGWLCDKATLKKVIIEAAQFENYSTLAKNAFESVRRFSLPTIMSKQLAIYKKIQLKEKAHDAIDHNSLL